MMFGSRKSSCAIFGVASWTSCFSHGALSLPERTVDRYTMVIQTWALGRYFLKNEHREPDISRKQWQHLLSRIKFELSSKNQNLGKFICLYELDSFSIQKDFSNEVNKCYYLIIYNKMFQHLEIYIIQWTNIFQMTKA